MSNGTREYSSTFLSMAVIQKEKINTFTWQGSCNQFALKKFGNISVLTVVPSSLLGLLKGSEELGHQSLVLFTN